MKILFRLVESKPDKFGLCPVFLDFSFKGKRLRYFTGEKCLVKDWDPKKMRFRRSFDGWLSANEYLESLETRLRVAFRGLVSEGIEPTSELLRSSLLPVPLPIEKASFTVDFGKFIEEKRPLIRASSLKNYQTVLSRLRRFESENEKIVEYDADFHKRFVSVQTSWGLHPNTIAKANSCIRSFLLSRGKKFPVKFKKEIVTERIFLSVSELDLMRCCELPEYLSKVRDAFVFCCFTGLRYSDLRGLRPSQIKERGSYSVIELIPEKSRSVVGSVKRIEVPLLGSAVEILKRYEGGFSSLPVISNQKMNEHIKQIAEKAGINERVQSVKYERGFPVVKIEPKWKLVTEVVQKRVHIFALKMQKMEVKKIKKSHAHYEADFKEEILRMLNSVKNVDEISKTFGIGRNVLYNWKSKSQIKTKTKTSEEQTTYSLKMISENEQPKKENARLQSERDILKKPWFSLARPVKRHI